MRFAAASAAAARPICRWTKLSSFLRRSLPLVALDDALNDFARIDPRKAQVVELRYFGGLSVEEAAAALNVHPNTVIRDWSLARVWLKPRGG